MKKNILLSFLLISSLQLIAQNANWGTGLPVSVNISGTSVDLSVFDPGLNQTKTTSLSVGSNPTYKNIDGVVVAFGGYGDMDYATYDVELHTWKTGTTQISSSNSAGAILTADGVVVGYGTQGDMDYATYDVELHTWKTGTTQISSSNSAGAILTADGVVVGYGTQGDMDYATYDVELHTWKTGTTQISSSNSAGTILTADGVVVGYGTQGDMDYAIYDFNSDSWKTGTQQLGSSGNISLSSGTITYSGSSSGIKGYNPNTKNWGSYYTTSTCKFLPVVSASSSWVFMRCMSIGAGTFTYSCGDGHQISRKQGWKKYNSDNPYNASLNVSNGMNNSTCNATINIATGLEEYNRLVFPVFPNPATDKIFIDCADRKGIKMQVYNITGGHALQNDLTDGKNMIDIGSLPSGIYMIRLSGSGGTYHQKLIKN